MLTTGEVWEPTPIMMKNPGGLGNQKKKWKYVGISNLKQLQKVKDKFRYKVCQQEI